MDSKPGLALVQQHLDTIQSIWRGVRATDPTQDDLVCIIRERPDGVEIKLGPRVTYVEQLERHHLPTGDLTALKQPAGDAAPKFPKNLAMWVVVPLQTGIALLRVTDDVNMPKLTSPGGSC